MTDTMLPGLETEPEDRLVGQWRLAHAELVNWGTFNGHTVMPVARLGQLVTGHSGSGKSSLLDAIATVLTPGRVLRLNAAAQDSSSKDDRSIVSYVRGAWSRESDAETDRIVSRYLRPGATWSGILLRYENGGMSAPVTLVRLFSLRADGSTNADLSTVSLVGPFEGDLVDFQPYAADGIQVRELKAAFPDLRVTTKASEFTARFTKLLGVRSENALILLHKTQSAKNFGSLDQLFRTFMLDTPATFEMANRAVERFTDLAEAHRLVVEARRQVEHLTPLTMLAETYDFSQQRSLDARRLSDAMDAYIERTRLELATAERDRLHADSDAAESASTEARSRTEEAQRQWDDARAATREAGGAALQIAQERAAAARRDAERIRNTRETVIASLEDVGVSMPASAADWSELQRVARQDADELNAARSADADANNALQDERRDAEVRRHGIEQQIDGIRRSKSNIPSALLDARTLVAQRTGLPESTFPFAGELISVRADFTRWQGAIERVLRPLATVLLVPADRIREVARAVDDIHLGTRLVFERATAHADAPRATTNEHSLVHRVTVAEHPMAAWLNKRLSDRFDAECVETADDLTGVEFGVTLAGQIKHGDRFEKDDRHRVGDRTGWILGGDTDDRLDLLLEQLREIEATVTAVRSRIDALTAEQHRATERAAALRFVIATPWTSVDLAAAQRAVDESEAAILRLTTESGDLRAAREYEERTRKAHGAAQRDEQTAVSRRDQIVAELGRVNQVIDATAATAVSLPEDIADALEARFHANQRSISYSTLDGIARRVQKELDDERAGADAAAGRAAEGIVALQTDFRHRWPAIAADLTGLVDDRAGYLAVLANLVSSGLPEHEENFFSLLREQSQQLTGQLLAEIRRAPREIRERIEPVNRSLRRSLFDKGRYLQIQTKLRQTPRVREFIEDLQSVTDGSWETMDEESAERRFGVLRTVMARLGSSDSRDQAWKAECLDTRLHVTFIGLEEDEGGAVLNVHDSSAGLSGGQRQKLVIFCLAAALRYQLADEDASVPSYGTVMLDEAFDKADAEFTRMAMDVFREFGFHMILATPLKLLQTLEDYVGAIAHVHCEDRKDSRISMLPIGEAA